MPTASAAATDRGSGAWQSRRDRSRSPPVSGVTVGSASVLRRPAAATGRAAAATRRRRDLPDDEPVEGLLRRRRVGPGSRKIYLENSNPFVEKFGLTESSRAKEVDGHLDQAIVLKYLEGEPLQNAKVLYYAIRWRLSFTNPELRLSFASLKGFERQEPVGVEEPEAWESVLLSAHALLSSTALVASRRERVMGAFAFLIAFDAYLRGGSVVGIRRTELRAPLSRSAGAASCWNLTLHPVTANEYSKTRTQDTTIMIGSSHVDRSWLTQLCPIAVKLAGPTMLIDIEAKRYKELFTTAWATAGVPTSHPHRLRHGGASMDGMQGPAVMSDLDIQQRGDWRTQSSVARYRRPARYLRRLQQLSLEQRTRAAALPPVIVRLCRELSR